MVNGPVKSFYIVIGDSYEVESKEVYPINLELSNGVTERCMYAYINWLVVPESIRDYILDILNKMYINHLRHKISSIDEPIYYIEISKIKPRLRYSDRYSYAVYGDLYITINLVSFYKRTNEITKLKLPSFVNMIYIGTLTKFPGSCDKVILDELEVPDNIDMVTELETRSMEDSLLFRIKNIKNIENIRSLELHTVGFKEPIGLKGKLKLNKAKYINIYDASGLTDIYLDNDCDIDALRLISCYNLRTIRLNDNILDKRTNKIKSAIRSRLNPKLEKIIAPANSRIIGMTIDSTENVTELKELTIISE